MRKNNGRRRQRGHNRRNINNINKNTVLESYGPVTQLRGNAYQLIEKYSSLASDAASSDDKVLSESYLQFADHYFRLNREIEISNEAKNSLRSEENKNLSLVNENNKNDDETVSFSKPTRKERSLQAKEVEDKVKDSNKDRLPKKFSKKENIGFAESKD